jgi:hypothetical protein
VQLAATTIWNTNLDCRRGWLILFFPKKRKATSIWNSPILFDEREELHPNANTMYLNRAGF